MLFKKNVLDEMLDQNIIKKNKIPILIRDQSWKKVFSQKINRTMEACIKQLQKLITEEVEFKKQLRVKKDKKQQLMNKILTFSDLVNTKGEEKALTELEKCREDINAINKELEELYQAVEVYPKEIEKANRELLKESLRVAYRELVDSQENLNEVNTEIAKLRERLNLLRIEQEELENKTESLYSFIHSMIGHEEVEKLDIHYLNER